MNSFGDKLTRALRKNHPELVSVKVELCTLNATGSGWMITRPNGSSVSWDGRRVFPLEEAREIAYIVSKELHG